MSVGVESAMWCAGNQCADAQVLAAADSELSGFIANIAEVTLLTLDDSIARQGPSYDQGTQKVVAMITHDIIAQNERAMAVIDEGRDGLRKISKRCITCTGVVDGLCPTFPLPDESEAGSSVGSEA